MVAILLGGPGSGKGTQSAKVCDALSLPHIATGDLFRENLKNKTELGAEAKSFMDAGKLVPDELVVRMLFERVSSADCAEGYLLDGFPRTIAQADIHTERVPGDWDVRVVNLEVEDSIIVGRASGRLLCRTCGNIHHEQYSPPAKQGECDADGGELYKRDDDRAEVVLDRLTVYHAQTKPLVGYYQERGLLKSVDGERNPDEVFKDVMGALSVDEGGQDR